MNATSVSVKIYIYISVFTNKHVVVAVDVALGAFLAT